LAATVQGAAFELLTGRTGSGGAGEEAATVCRHGRHLTRSQHPPGVDGQAHSDLTEKVHHPRRTAVMLAPELHASRCKIKGRERGEGQGTAHSARSRDLVPN